MDERLMRTRRVFLKSGIFIGGAALAGVGMLRAAEKEEEEVSRAENLMREHGVLKRVLASGQWYTKRAPTGRCCWRPSSC